MILVASARRNAFESEEQIMKTKLTNKPKREKNNIKGE